ncbi:MAG: hypothetical protein MOIL_00153 [Candidatus Methanolliviera sp. GoM_oil]|nr:MAG: hypothetical protein MOIL_00153 [Candidatus Methanolliviera sp. GoM_oil]
MREIIPEGEGRCEILSAKPSLNLPHLFTKISIDSTEHHYDQGHLLTRLLIDPIKFLFKSFTVLCFYEVFLILLYLVIVLLNTVLCINKLDFTSIYRYLGGFAKFSNI